MADTGDISDEKAQHPKSLLIVEDNEDIGMFLVTAIESETPYHSMLANNPQQALEAIQTVRPDLFILDYQLPQMDGLKLYDHLHTLEAFQEIPAMLMSANLPVDEIKKRGISSIHKPFELEEFLEKIEALLADDPRI